MGPLAKALRLWHTVRWLKPVQVYGRVWFRVARPKPDVRAAPRVRAAGGPWAEPARREASLVSATQLRFLGEERDLDAHGWDDKALAKLWRYNQHYFDDLCAFGATERAAWHRALIARWMRECPPGKGTAWEPYPTSLRIVNWIKWLRAGNEPVEGMLDSLAAQVRFLGKRLEWHLLGNHLFVNAKALVIAGLYFEGEEADAWRERGWRILRAEIPEQILSDGGQFERSPMYHALAVEDMLDLLNAMQAHPDVCAAADERRVTERIGAMRAFLSAVCHPDGEVAFFNDSAQGVAPTRAELEGYAVRLGLPVQVERGLPVQDRGGASGSCGLPVQVVGLQPSGFVRMDVPSHGMAAIMDVGPVGPDYLPGHAHADTLSFELSVGGQRVLVNSGVSQYGLGCERLRQRGTAAHNTVTLDGTDSSEVWGGFRVARRALASLLRADACDERAAGELGRVGAVVEAQHDGFLRLAHGGMHRRTWRLHELSGLPVQFAADAGLPVQARLGLTVQDWLESRGVVESHWHFAPGIELEVLDGGRILAAMGLGFRFRFAAEGAVWRVARSTYHPRFGVSVPNWKAIALFEGAVATVRIEWQPCTSSS
jgi:uncharacterized heparinase superfamily protein